jgi:uncharacterized glyoxalase superfamily protein PhnB
MNNKTPAPQVWPTLRARDARALTPGCGSAYVVTSQPDALFARATAAGAEVLTELTDTDYGSRDFAVRDPEGNRWYFGTYRGAPVG